MPIGGEIVLTQKSEHGPISADVAVVQGTEADLVRLPHRPNERAKGVTALRADARNKALPIVILGPAVGTAAEPIFAGEFVIIADVRGHLRPAPPPNDNSLGTYVEVVGFAVTSAPNPGDTFDLVVLPFRYKA